MTAFYRESNAQECLHTELSNILDFKVLPIKAITEDSVFRIRKVSVIILNKSERKELQRIEVDTEFMYEVDFTDCSKIRSYATGYNKNFEALDNDYGDFIVADFNFDSREDFAVKKDAGGNGGPLYEFFLQNTNNRFERSTFLSEEMVFFPTEINQRKRELVTYVHAWVCGLGKHVYALNSKTNKWKEKSHRIINICKK